MTPEQEAEWNYRYEERLGMMCEDREPTARQRYIASQEAHAAVGTKGDDFAERLKAFRESL